MRGNHSCHRISCLAFFDSILHNSLFFFLLSYDSHTRRQAWQEQGLLPQVPTDRLWMRSWRDACIHIGLILNYLILFCHLRNTIFTFSHSPFSSSLPTLNFCLLNFLSTYTIFTQKFYPIYSFFAHPHRPFEPFHFQCCSCYALSGLSIAQSSNICSSSAGESEMNRLPQVECMLLNTQNK